MIMKTLTLLASLFALFLSSCINYYFESPLPLNKTEMNQFPKSLAGTYKSQDRAKLHINDTSITIYDASLTGEDLVFTISDSVVVKPFGEKTLVSLRELKEVPEKTVWMVFCLETIDETLSISLLEPEDSSEVAQMKRITRVEALEEGSSDMILNPETEELKQLFEAGLFKKLDAFRKEN